MRRFPTCKAFQLLPRNAREARRLIHCMGAAPLSASVNTSPFMPFLSPNASFTCRSSYTDYLACPSSQAHDISLSCEALLAQPCSHEGQLMYQPTKTR